MWRKDIQHLESITYSLRIKVFLLNLNGAIYFCYNMSKNSFSTHNNNNNNSKRICRNHNKSLNNIENINSSNITNKLLIELATSNTTKSSCKNNLIVIKFNCVNSCLKYRKSDWNNRKIIKYKKNQNSRRKS